MAAAELRHCIEKAFPYDKLSFGLDGSYTLRSHDNGYCEAQTWNHITGSHRVDGVVKQSIPQDRYLTSENGSWVISSSEDFLSSIFSNGLEELKSLINTLRTNSEDQPPVPVPLQLEGEPITVNSKKEQSYYNLADVLQEDTPEDPDVIKHLESASKATKSAEPFTRMANNFSMRGYKNATSLCYLYAAFVEITNNNLKKAICMAQQAQRNFNNTSLSALIGDLFYKTNDYTSALQVFKSIKEEPTVNPIIIACKIILCDPNNTSNYKDLAKLHEERLTGNFEVCIRHIYIYAYMHFRNSDPNSSDWFLSEAKESPKSDALSVNDSLLANAPSPNSVLPHLVQYYTTKWDDDRSASEATTSIGKHYMCLGNYMDALYFFELASSKCPSEEIYGLIVDCNLQLDQPQQNIGVYLQWGSFHREQASQNRENDEQVVRELFKSVDKYVEAMKLNEELFDIKMDVFSILIEINGLVNIKESHPLYYDRLLVEATSLSKKKRRDNDLDEQINILLTTYTHTQDSAFGIKLARIYQELERFEESGDTYFEIALREYKRDGHISDVLHCLDKISNLKASGQYIPSDEQKDRIKEMSNYSTLQRALAGMLQSMKDMGSRIEKIDTRLAGVERFMNGTVVSVLRKMDGTNN